MKFQTPKGTRDLMPDDAEKLKFVIRTVSDVFEKYGFKPLYTPAFENFDLLMAKGGLGEAVKDEIYYFRDKSDRELGLRFDLTMPLARIIASNPQIQKPFKRYAIDKVWRYDNPQAMRWREFWQADIDTVGVKSIIADAEIIAAACECMSRLGIKDYKIRANNRKFAEKEISKAVPQEKITQVFRIIDKLDKIGKEGVMAELKKIDCDKKQVKDLISDKESVKKDPEVKELISYLKDFGVDDNIEFDSSLMRGLEYYTGLVFELSLGGTVSCGGGGRYDNLIGKIGGRPVEAIGFSLGLDRILEVMKEKNLFTESESRADVMVANVDDTVMGDVISISKKLREKGIPVQMNLTDRYLSKQLEFANSQKIRYVVIVGRDEVKKKKFKLRDMKSETQKEMSLEQIIRELNPG
jgi:histidyl-tRNA synthetase